MERKDFIASARTIVSQVASGQMSAAQDTINTTLSTCIQQSIDSGRTAIAQSVVAKPEGE